MRNKRTVGALAVLLAVLLGCFFMPDFVSGLIDRSTLGRPTIQDAGSISYEARPNLSMPERLTLISSSNHERIMLKNSKLSESETRALVTSELSRFFGTSGLISGLSAMTIDECLPMFVIDADTSANMIVWQTQLSSASGMTLTVIVDEETGMILHIFGQSETMLKSGGSDIDLYKDAEKLLELIGEYYGMPAELTYKLSGELGYYNVELDYDEARVALYGIVRTYGLSVNERLLY